MINEKAVTLKQLRALAAIHRAGNLTLAAQELHVTTPAVSTQLKLLEANFEAVLLKRSKDGTATLTGKGRVVLATIKQIENSLTTCYENVNALKSGKTGHLTLGVVSTAKYFAPSIVMLARQAMPDVEISLFVGNRRTLIEAITDLRVDLAIMGRPPRFPAVEAHLLGEHPHVMVAHPGHRLVSGCDISPQEMMAQTFLSREPGSGTRILMERFLDRIGDGAEYKTVLLDSNETIKQAAIAGLGVALISAHTVQAELETNRLALIPYPGLPIMRHWFLIHRSGKKLSAVAQSFNRFVIDQNGSFLP